MPTDRGTRVPLRGCRSLAVFRALQLGDLLCAVPALRALRESAPGARITLVGLPWARAFVARFHRYVDDFVAFPGSPQLPEQTPDVARLPAFFADMQARRFDLALQMHGSGVQTNAIVAQFGARNSAGFHAGDEHAADVQTFLPYPFDLHEIRRNLRLVEFLGATVTGDNLEFPLTQNDHDELAAIRDARSLSPGRYACLHAGARNPAKRWPIEQFAQVADALHDRGLEIVLTGSGAERPIAEAVARAMRAPSRNLALPVTIGAMAALIADARVLVTNDTGVSHVATGLHAPSVVVFFATNPAQWAPLDTRLHRTVYRPHDVDVDTVLSAVFELLDDIGGDPAPGVRAPRAPMPGAAHRRA